MGGCFSRSGYDSFVLLPHRKEGFDSPRRLRKSIHCKDMLLQPQGCVRAQQSTRGETTHSNEVNRQYFLKILNEQYLLEFDAKEGDIVRDIYRLASNHGEIVEDAHDYEKCPVCRNGEGLVRQLKRYLDKNPNPIEKGVQKYPRDTPTGAIQESR